MIYYPWNENIEIIPFVHEKYHTEFKKYLLEKEAMAIAEPSSVFDF